MIYYFSGTGNARWVARELAQRLSLAAKPIGEYLCTGMPFSLSCGDEPVWLVFPVHSWGPAVSMLDFIERCRFEGYASQPFYAVCVCGDDCGRADKIVRKALRRKGVELTAAFSVQMPNNYILLPGFDVDSLSVERQKLQAAPQRVQAIVEAVQNGDTRSLYHAGALPWLKSAVYPLFRRYARAHNTFYATDACTGCGRCAALCPAGVIEPTAPGEPPRWKQKGCVQCLSCIHRCPFRAVEYGKISLKKGRYTHPDCR